MANDIWKNDLLAREGDAEFLYRLAVGRNQENVRTEKGSFVLNIDAPWGQGKSFFLNAVYESVKASEHPAIFINAWQYDFVDDPFAICVAALDEYFKSIDKKEVTRTEKFQCGLRVLRAQFYNISWAIGKSVLKKVVNKVSEDVIEEVKSTLSIHKANEGERKKIGEEIVDAIGSDFDTFASAAIDKLGRKQIDDINETKRSLDLFQGGLKLIIEAMGEANSHQLPMFIFVDELDRCRPTYAISMLERIKHIFDVPNVVFIIATDTESLSHSVKAVYGGEFKSREYLGRFFNRTYKLPQAPNEKIILSMLIDRGTDLSKWSLPLELDLKTAAIFFDQTAAQFGLNIRPTKQAIEILMDITSAWDRDYPIELSYMFTLVCQFVKTSRLDENEFGELLKEKLNWGFTINGKRSNYRDLVFRVRNVSNTGIKEARAEIDTVRTHDVSDITMYLHKILLEEYQTIEFVGRINPVVSFSKYPEVILHSRNLI